MRRGCPLEQSIEPCLLRCYAGSHRATSHPVKCIQVHVCERAQQQVVNMYTNPQPSITTLYNVHLMTHLIMGKYTYMTYTCTMYVCQMIEHLFLLHQYLFCTCKLNFQHGIKTHVHCTFVNVASTPAR